MNRPESTIDHLPSAKLVVVTGPTASGKSSLAMSLAKRFNGEIVAADSMTIYKGMDIGTDKPTKADQKAVKHWTLDIAGPGQRFTAADFKEYAEQAIADIQSRGKLPVVVGGTGLYIDALIYDFSFGQPVNLKQRQGLQKLSIEELQVMIKQKGYSMPENSKNRRHLVRTIERQGQSGQRAQDLPKGFIVVGMLPADEELKTKIGRRVEAMFDEGLVDETKKMAAIYKPEGLLTKAKVCYGPVWEYLNGLLSLEEAKERLKIVHWQFARRQKTWFRRNPHINWFSDQAKAEDFVSSQLG